MLKVVNSLGGEKAVENLHPACLLDGGSAGYLYFFFVHFYVS
jgi:hypothetical protein